MHSAKEIADQLASAIKLGNFTEVRNLVDTITDVQIIRDIEAQFEDRDPLISAIECREEVIALYLVEKGFNHRLLYTWPGKQCDQWCLREHGDDPCPLDYDALILAVNKNMIKVVKVVSDIRAGLRKPGDGLALMQHPGIKREDSSFSNKRLRSVASSAVGTVTACEAARRRLKELGLQRMRAGTPLIHFCNTPAMVHVAASLAVSINAADFDGDTALHVAARQQDAALAQALLVNGADPTLRNKLGQSPSDISSSYMRDVMAPFRCGLHQTLMRGEASGLQRLLRLWINPFSVITRDGKTGFEVAELKSGDLPSHKRCYNNLLSLHKTLEVTHSVLSEDVNSLKRLLRTEAGWTLNNRYKNKTGPTLLSCAIEQHNLEVVQLLAETGQCQLNIRVPEQPDTIVTVPLLFKTLEKDCPDEIWSYLDHQVDCYQATEKDFFGNTALLRAIANGRSASFVQRFLRRHESAIFQRNSEGQNAREFALDLGRKDIVSVIDSFLVSKGNTCFMLEVPVNFYGEENINVYNEDGKSMLSAAERCEGPWRDDVLRAVLEYSPVEELGTRLHKAAAQGRLKRVAKLNSAPYRDRNGYTALIRAIVYEQLEAAEMLITERPALKQIPDNSNRYPLHYAYALPADTGAPFIHLLLQKNPEDVETRFDNLGRQPAEYKELRDTEDILAKLHDARTLDTHGKRCPGLGLLPLDAVDAERLVQEKLRIDLQGSFSATTISSLA